MSRGSKKRKRDANRKAFEADLAAKRKPSEAAAGGKADYTAKAGGVIKGSLGRGEGGKFVNATDLIKAGKPLAVDIGLNPGQLQSMLWASNGNEIDDGDVYDELWDMGLLDDKGKLNSRARSIMSALKKNDMDLAKKLADKYVKKPKAPKAKAKPKAAPKKAAPQKPDAKAQADQLAGTSGTDVKTLNNILDVAGGASLDPKVMGFLQQMGAIEFVDGKPKLSAAGKALVDSLNAGDQKAAASALKGLKPATKTKEAATMPYKLDGKCVYKDGGELVKCHDTPEKAKAHYEALQANVPEAQESALYDCACLDYEISIGEATKTMGGATYQVGDFLVVDDKEKPSTWRLPVKKNGKPDRAMAGAAWAALFSPTGHRGQKYAGPDKDKAKSALKALYKAEEWPMPGENTEAQSTVNMGEMYNDYRYTPLGVKSFADLKAAQQAREAVGTIREYSSLFPIMIDNILSSDEENKQAAIEALATEFASEVSGILKNGKGNGDMQEDDAVTDELGEAIALFDVADISESDADRYAKVVEEGVDTHAYLDIIAIKPGWGNKRDNHYYPSEVVSSETTRGLFVGAKMYESEHNPDTKDNTTWVSTIVEAVGLDTSSGAPIYRVAIHDPYFTEKVRNLNKMGLLDRLECSIMGEGKATPNFREGGRAGKRLTEFSAIHNVDWVTRAGAGGHALALVENSNGGNTEAMEENKDKKPEAVASNEAQTVSVSEQQNTQAQPEVQPQAPQPEAPKTVEAAEVAKLLEASTLPQAARKRLAGASYSDAKAVEAAITNEVEYLKEITGSGRPVGSGSTLSTTSKEKLEEADKAKDAITARFIGK